MPHVLSFLCVLLLLVLLPQGSYTQQDRTIVLPGGVPMEMVWIDSGTFTMGSPPSEPGRWTDEGPQHQVTISRGFYMGKFELTQQQWESVMGTQPWTGRPNVQEQPRHPAVYISWHDIQQFTGQLNNNGGAFHYRLPTAAEWEYAARAGTETCWSFGDEEDQLSQYGWFKENAWDAGVQYAHAVGQKAPNPWGLYDIYGNVWEWTQDWYGPDYYQHSPEGDPLGPLSGAYRVRRGGSFDDLALSTRAAFCGINSPDYHDFGIGARLVMQRSETTGISPKSWGQIKANGL